MSKALNEKPNAEPLPVATGAGVILNGRYLPPPEDKDGKIWVRTSALIHAAPKIFTGCGAMLKPRHFGKSRSKK